MHVFREIYMIYNWAGWELQFRYVNCWHFLNPSENFPLLSEKEDYISSERLREAVFLPPEWTVRGGEINHHQAFCVIYYTQSITVSACGASPFQVLTRHCAKWLLYWTSWV